MNVRCDVSDESSVDQAFAALGAGSAAILVNNAAIFRMASIVDTDPDAWNQMLSINLTGTFLCSKRVLPAMREAGFGRIVSNGSSTGRPAAQGTWRTSQLRRRESWRWPSPIASEYAAYGVASNAFAPAPINTDMVFGVADLKDRIPVGRLGEPEDVARAVLFLAAE